MLLFSPPRSRDVVLITVSLLGGMFILLGSDWTGGMFVENGPIEIVQMSTLVIAGVLFIRAAFRLDEWAGVATLSLAAMSIVFLVRETPRCTSPFYEFGPCVSADYKDAVYVVGGLLVALCGLANPALRFRKFNRESFARLPRFMLRLWPVLLVAVLVGFGQLADTFYWPRSEESFELAAYVVLAMCGLRAAQAGDRIASDPHGHEFREVGARR